MQNVRLANSINLRAATNLRRNVIEHLHRARQRTARASATVSVRLKFAEFFCKKRDDSVGVAEIVRLQNDGLNRKSFQNFFSNKFEPRRRA